MSRYNVNLHVSPLNAAGFFCWLNNTGFLLIYASVVFPYLLNSLEVYLFFYVFTRDFPLLELLHFPCPKWVQCTSHFCIQILDAATVINEMFAWAVQCVFMFVCVYTDARLFVDSTNIVSRIQVLLIF